MVKNPEETLEPEAVFCRDHNLCTPDQANALSIAISLKRLADFFCGCDGRQDFVSYLIQEYRNVHTN